MFPISHRNSPEALASLLSRTQARFVLTSKESGIEAVVSSAENIFPTGHTFPVKFDMFSFPDLYNHDGRPVSSVDPSIPWAIDDPQLIMHSSGPFYLRVTARLRTENRCQDLLLSRTPSYGLLEVT